MIPVHIDVNARVMVSGAKTEKTRCAGTHRDRAVARDDKRGMTSWEACSAGESVVKMNIGYWHRWFDVQLSTKSTVGDEVVVNEEHDIHVPPEGLSDDIWSFAFSAWGSIIFELHGFARKVSQTRSGMAAAELYVSME